MEAASRSITGCSWSYHSRTRAKTRWETGSSGIYHLSPPFFKVPACMKVQALRMLKACLGLIHVSAIPSRAHRDRFPRLCIGPTLMWALKSENSTVGGRCCGFGWLLLLFSRLMHPKIALIRSQGKASTTYDSYQIQARKAPMRLHMPVVWFKGL